MVDEANAVGGFDTRPSERMADLVASGRTPEPRSPRVGGAPPAGIAAVPPTGACASMRQQIADLDAAARQPGYSLRRLDEIRAVRQDIRTTMARDHC